MEWQIAIQTNDAGRGIAGGKKPKPYSGFGVQAPTDCWMAKGLMLIQLGDMRTGPGYGIRIPGPIGEDGKPGSIRILRDLDRMRVLVDDVPLIPGPPDLDGPLSLRIATVLGTNAILAAPIVVGRAL